MLMIGNKRLIKEPFLLKQIFREIVKHKNFFYQNEN